jgi:hypothetical protein
LLRFYREILAEDKHHAFFLTQARELLFTACKVHGHGIAGGRESAPVNPGGQQELLKFKSRICGHKLFFLNNEIVIF